MGALLNRRRYMGGVAREPRLPAEYQEVKYIKNVDATIGLGTGFKFNFRDYEFECTFSKNSVPTDNEQGVFGTNFGNNQQFKFRFDVRTGRMVMCFSNKEDIVISTFNTDKHTIRYVGGASSQELYYDDSLLRSYTYTDLPTTTTYSLGLYRNGSTGKTFKDGLIYHVFLKRISTDSILLDYIPCKRKADSYPGFYDLATDSFMTITDADLHWVCGPNFIGG